MKSSQIYSTRKNKYLIYPVLILFIVLLAVLSLSLGAVSIPFNEIVSFFFNGDITQSHRNIILYTRIPRTIASMLAGSALAVSGYIIQSVLSNPLAAPNIIGVNSGAGFGLVISSFLFPKMFWLNSVSAFAGAFLAVMVVLFVSEKTGASKITLILAGVAVSGIFTAGIDTIINIDSNVLASYTDFKAGGFSGVTMAKLYPAIVLIALSLFLTILFSTELEVLMLGRDEAQSLGLNSKKFRVFFLLLSAVLAGSAVSFAGIIGFVGLLVPHIIRRTAPEDTKNQLISSALGGAVLVSLADLLSRLIFAPYELPVGIFLSFIGGPFFLYLIFKQRGGRRHD